MLKNSRDKIYIPRTLEGKIWKLLDAPEIIAIFGARQVGKTTLMKHIFHSLKEPKIFLDFEDPELVSLFDEDVKTFARLYVEGRKYVFIDEFQHSNVGGKHLKFLYDLYPTKFLISGSSSLELAVKAASALVGRIFILELYPLSFQELVSHRVPELFSVLQERISGNEGLPQVLHSQLMGLIEEFTLWGGYPRIATARDREEKIQILKGILSTYLLRDIRGFFRLATESGFQKLLKALALQVGGLIRYGELSQVSGLSYSALRKYLSILEETYIISLARPFFTNRRLEIVKNPKVYFQDLGIRNYLCRDFRNWEVRTDKGALIENFVASELLKKGISLCFWRTKSGGEVDFVIQGNGEVIPVEVKSGVATTPGKSFVSFIKKYKPSRAYVFHSGGLFSLETTGTKVWFWPLYTVSCWQEGDLR